MEDAGRFDSCGRQRGTVSSDRCPAAESAANAGMGSRLKGSLSVLKERRNNRKKPSTKSTDDYQAEGDGGNRSEANGAP